MILLVIVISRFFILIYKYLMIIINLCLLYEFLKKINVWIFCLLCINFLGVKLFIWKWKFIYIVSFYNEGYVFRVFFNRVLVKRKSIYMFFIYDILIIVYINI